VIGLPRQLSPWAAQLQLFPRELALALGSLVARLSLLMGSGRPARAVEADPDGYDGVARKGAYEQLLPTEWLLLDELPEEFLRRVVAGEHAFLRRAQRHERAGRGCLALFDTGIDQLGAPRIAQLALLIVLARRAAEAGAAFEWGSLQYPELALRSAVSAASLREFVRARCQRPLSVADLDRWAAYVRSSPRSELWLIGSESILRQASQLRASAIVVADVLDPEPPQRISVRVFPAPLDRSRDAVLKVPAERLAVQLLRDPFAAATSSPVSPVRVDAGSSLLFSLDGRRLYVRAVSSALVSLLVPNSPRASPGAPIALLMPEGHALISVGRSAAKKRAVVLTQCGPELFLHLLSKRGASIAESVRCAPSDGYTVPEPASHLLCPLGVLDGERHFFIDRAGDLVQLFEGRVQLELKADAVASRALYTAFAWATLQGGVPRISWATADASGQLRIAHASAPAAAPASSGAPGFHFGRGLAELFAYPTSGAAWAIGQRQCWIQRVVAATHTVVGVVERGNPAEAALVALDETRTRLELILPERTETLLTTSAPVTNVAVSGTGQEIAVLTSTGELGVYSCACRAVVLRMAGGVAA
jgi:hypothetical protein